MPLLNQEPWDLVLPPEDLEPNESVFKVRFTNEIFRNYEDYLKRMNLYRQRIWTCNMTGKSGLTYEEASLSECKGKEDALQLPKEMIAPALKLVQFSSLGLDDLVTEIYERLKGQFLEGEEVQGKKEESVCRCRVLKVFKGSDPSSICYGVAWLDARKNVISTSIEMSENLIRKKQPFSRKILKSLILASTLHSSPWILRRSLAQKHGIPTELPEQLKSKILSKSTQLDINEEHDAEMLELEKDTVDEKKRQHSEADGLNAMVNLKRKKTGAESQLENVHLADESSYCIKDIKLNLEKIKYPIDDLLVVPVAGDPIYAERPIPCTKFSVPMECVGNLIMVWDFCSSFCKLLCLSPFSLEDFENAIVFNSGDLDLIVEVHSAILVLIITDGGKFHEKRRMPKITSANWMDHLLRFFEKRNLTNIFKHLVKLKDANYCKLDVRIKLNILSELVSCALMTDVVRGQLDEYIEQREALVATKREEDLEELRKRREEKKLEQIKPDTKDSLCQSLGALDDRSLTINTKVCCESIQALSKEAHLSEPLTNGAWSQENKNDKHDVLTSRRANMRQKQEAKMVVEKEKELKRREELRRLREQRIAKANEARAKKLKEQKQEHFDRKIEKWVIKPSPLGKDRNHNTYWFFKREGRVFVESADHEQWGFYSSKEELDGLMASLNPKGERELALKGQLEKQYIKLCSAMQKRSKDVAQRVKTDTSVLRRSVRVCVPPKDNSVPAFLTYANKWREQ